MTQKGKIQQFCSPQDHSRAVGFWTCKDQNLFTGEDTHTHTHHTHSFLSKNSHRAKLCSGMTVSPGAG